MVPMIFRWSIHFELHHCVIRNAPALTKRRVISAITCNGKCNHWSKWIMLYLRKVLALDNPTWFHTMERHYFVCIWLMHTKKQAHRTKHYASVFWWVHIRRSQVSVDLHHSTQRLLHFGHSASTKFVCNDEKLPVRKRIIHYQCGI